jgi:hypothetical protein
MTAMSSGLASLHKILKDETRTKIILLQNEIGPISNTDLIDVLGRLASYTIIFGGNIGLAYFRQRYRVTLLL